MFEAVQIEKTESNVVEVENGRQRKSFKYNVKSNKQKKEML